MAPSQTFLRIPLILLLIFPVVSDATNSTSSKNTTKSASESQTNDAAKCLKSLNDVKRELTSTVPPLHGWTTDNYNNISRALFPGVKLPSLYIKVTLQFIVNDTGPGTGKLSDEVLKFTWSQSCIFVSNVCLNATTVFSLGTVYPQRRETDLALSVHKLCEGASKTNGFKNDNETWIYALFGLQDICILPNVSDPRVNTAQCVILGHYGDKDQPFVHPSEWYNYREVWIFFTSILLAITICWYAVNWLNRGNRDQYKNTFLWSVVWLFIFSIVLISVEIAFVANCKCRHSHSTKFIFLILHFVFYFVSFLANVAISHKCPPDGMSVMVPCIYQVAHHLLWVLCAGIPADPSWAIPLFLCECLVIFSLVCATYFYHKAARNDTRKLVICQLSVSYIAICLAVFTVAISFFGHSVADIPTNNILEIIMVAVLLWAIKNSGLAPGNNDNDNNNDNGNNDNDNNNGNNDNDNNNDNGQGRPGNGEAIEMRERERQPLAAR